MHARMEGMASTGKKSARKRTGQTKRAYKKRPWKRRELLMLGIISDAKVDTIKA